MQMIEGARKPKMTPQEDIEAFLESFERAALAAKWDWSGWPVQLGPLLTGPTEAYWALLWVDAMDYKKVKRTSLYHLEISLVYYWQCF